jgi:phosphoribosylformylglycinamidine synthase subunit PurSL
MTLVVEPGSLAALEELARLHEVELSDLGEFTADGFLEVRFDGAPVARLELDFLHDGVPRKRMSAEWGRLSLEEPALAPITDHGEILLRLLHAPNICSRERVIRQYDHEVKGRSVLKPLMGRSGRAPQDAAVLRLDLDSWAGIAVSNGIAPAYGDIDPYEMSAGAFDEAVRQIVAVGGRLPRPGDHANGFWSVCDNFCMPDSEYDPLGNPDGRLKLGKLVRMCQALYDMALCFNIPMTSGKDSMKNDFRSGPIRISVPPTLLFSMVAKIDDVRRVVSADFKAAGDVVYLVGETYDELGGSEFYRLFDEVGANVPRVRRDSAAGLYGAMAAASSAGLFQSCHDLSQGGLGVGLAESLFGRPELGLALELPRDMDLTTQLFSESHSRFVVSVRPRDRAAVESALRGRVTRLGKITDRGRMIVRHGGTDAIDLGTDELLDAWTSGLEF